MNAVDPDAVDRVAKLIVDAGDAPSFAAATELLQTYRIQIVAGTAACENPAWQAAIVTAVNVAGRAVHGGVSVTLEANPALRLPLAGARTLSEACRRFGGRVESDPLDGLPTIGFAVDVSRRADKGAVHPFAGQWIAGVAPQPLAYSGHASTVAAVMAAAMAVGECFQRLRGHVLAADRTAAVSLWNPNRDAFDPSAEGPAIGDLPADVWLLGLGHLGQAYAWLLSLLPYPKSSLRRAVLQDDDCLSPANRATSMLHTAEQTGIRKTRLVAAALEHAGWQTAIIERRYLGGRLAGLGDPTTLLAGVDNRDARRRLDEAGFQATYDAGLGAGPDGYLDMAVRRLPARRPSNEIWAAQAKRRAGFGRGEAAYRDLERATGDRCGVEMLAGRSVATAFVGMVAAAWILGGILRELHGGKAFELIDYTLRDPAAVDAVEATRAQPLRVRSVRAV